MINHIIKCPFCGSSRIEQHFEPEGSKTISRGLPDHFRNGKWFYFVCLDCFDKDYKNEVGIDFVFTVVKGVYFPYDGKQQIWVPKGMIKEVVEFT